MRKVIMMFALAMGIVTANAQEIYLKELGSESPMLVRLIMKSIHKQNKREVKHCLLYTSPSPRDA